MENNKEKHSYSHYPKDNIITTLDTVFDTRLGLLYSINENIAEKCLMNGGYHIRIRDNFGPISQDIFSGLYRFRTKALLEYALPSKILHTLIIFLLRSTMDAPHKTRDVQPILYINYYPYDLTEKEISRLAIMIGSSLSLPSDYVKFIRMDYDELTPKYVNDTAHTLVMYDGMEWLSYQTTKKRVNKDPIVGCSLFVPFLLTGTLGLNKLTPDAVKTASLVYKPIINLEFVDAVYFVFQERNQEEQTKSE